MNVQKTTINALRVLSAEAIETAKSGHPGLPLGCPLCLMPHVQYNGEQDTAYFKDWESRDWNGSNL